MFRESQVCYTISVSANGFNDLTGGEELAVTFSYWDMREVGQKAIFL